MCAMLSFLHTRYSCKRFDPDRRIAPEILAELRAALRLAPSALNTQPWRFWLAETPEAKARVARAMPGDYAYNAQKTRDAPLALVLATRTTLEDGFLDALMAQEDRDGRFATPELRMERHAKVAASIHAQRQAGTEAEWCARQGYIALGVLLAAAAALGLDACPMEGFERGTLEAELDLRQQGFRPLTVVALGYRAADDFNARLPKSRLPEAELFRVL